jgi:hypothetical protein
VLVSQAAKSIIQQRSRCLSEEHFDNSSISLRVFGPDSARKLSIKLVTTKPNRFSCKLDHVLTSTAQNHSINGIYVTQKLSPESGFHSKFVISVESAVEQPLVLISHLPRDAFFDRFEINRIDFGSLNVKCYGDAHLEAPAHVTAAKDNFLAISNITNRMATEIPFHFRYQPASSTDRFRSVTIPKMIGFGKSNHSTGYIFSTR